LVQLTSASPARRFGLYPRKGSLRPGADADLVLVDPHREWTLEPEHLLTRWPLSPFVGRAFRGQVLATLVRGTPVYRDGQLVAPPAHGRLITPSTARSERQEVLLE
jgi:dihydroorotase-like cyclic amidohydrolase